MSPRKTTGLNPPIRPAANIGRLLQGLNRSYQTNSARLLKEGGWNGLSLAHTVLLDNLDEDGNRCTTVTERAGITKQSMGAVADLLVEQGCITMEDDPDDGRARIMRFTQRGRKFHADANAIRRKLEDEYRRIIGKDDFDVFLKTLETLDRETRKFRN